MVNVNKLYGLLALNLFILLPLAFETYNPSLSISFSGLAFIFCPIISILSILMMIKCRELHMIHRLIALLGHSGILLYILVLSTATL